MESIFGLLTPLVVLAIIGAVIYAIVQRVRRGRRLERQDPGIGTVRRLYFYFVSFVALMMAANGLVQIVQYLLEAIVSTDVVSPSNARLAVGASLTIVGLPLWAFHWISVQRKVRATPVEVRSLLRKLYNYAVLGVAVGLTITASVSLLEWAFRTKSFSGYPWGALLIWVAVWAFHWRIEEAEGQPTVETTGIRRLYLYVVSLAGLVMVAVALGRIMHTILLEGYDSMVSLPVLVPGDADLWRHSLRAALAVAMVGTAVWGTHWLHIASRDLGSVLRRIYLYIFAVLGGAVTVLVSAGFVINGALTWLFGLPTDESTASHFGFLPGAIASLSVGIALWTYHWTVARREAESSPDEWQDTRRTYAYILSALGLAALAFGVGTLVNTAVSLLTESSRELLAGENLWKGPIALIITLGLLGGALWGYYWPSIQRAVGPGDVGERTALARRIFIFAVLGVGMMALLGSVSGLIFVFLRDVLGEGLSLETLWDARGAVDVVVVAAVFVPYYWMVYRQDRKAEAVTPAAAPPTLRKEVTVLVAEDADRFIGALEATLGYGVETLLWADADARSPELSEDQLHELAQRIRDAAGASVLLVPDGASVRVLSYD